MGLEAMLSSPFVWLGVAAVAALIEAVSVSLLTLWFVIGGIAAFFTSYLGAPAWMQLVVFLAVSLASLALLRPVALKYRTRGQSHEATLVGSTAVVVEEINAQAQTGRVETPDRITWTALSGDGSTIPRGANVKVTDQQSIKLVVERI